MKRKYGFLPLFLLLSLPFILIFPSPLLFSLILAWSPSVCASVCVHERPDSPLNWVVLIREQTFYFGDASAKMHGIKRAEGMLSCRWRECVYMCYRLRSRFPFVCVCVWAEKKKGHIVWLREAEDGKKEDMCAMVSWDGYRSSVHCQNINVHHYVQSF